VGYVVVAVTPGAGFEQDLAADAERQGVAVNAVATSTQAEITHDHAFYALISGLFLLLPPVFLLRAEASEPDAWLDHLAACLCTAGHPPNIRNCRDQGAALRPPTTHREQRK
jgi:hypothetical protein